MKIGIKVIAFDLDDTLLDTSRLLIPMAINEAFQAMIGAGLEAKLDQCMVQRQAFSKEPPEGMDLFEFTVTRLTTSTSSTRSEVIGAGRKAFYQRDISPDLIPFDGAHVLLEQLKKSYVLYLVTAGDPGTQKKKIDILKLTPYFRQLYFVDGLLGQKKQDAFSSIIEKEGIDPVELLSVGNRRDKEIEEAKRVGATTCLVQYGEYMHLRPANPYQKPDYEISHIRDLISTCSL